MISQKGSEICLVMKYSVFVIRTNPHSLAAHVLPSSPLPVHLRGDARSLLLEVCVVIKHHRSGTDLQVTR